MGRAFISQSILVKCRYSKEEQGRNTGKTEKAHHWSSHQCFCLPKVTEEILDTRTFSLRS